MDFEYSLRSGFIYLLWMVNQQIPFVENTIFSPLPCSVTFGIN